MCCIKSALQEALGFCQSFISLHPIFVVLRPPILHFLPGAPAAGRRVCHCPAQSQGVIWQNPQKLKTYAESGKYGFYGATHLELMVCLHLRPFASVEGYM
jgi:hypothetical protein